MTFLEILQDPVTNLPIQIRPGDTFQKTLKSALEKFGSIINNSNNLSGPVNGINFTAEVFKKRNKDLRDGILNTVDVYLQGKPSEAFRILSIAMKRSNMNGYLEKNDRYRENSNFFRIRKQSSNFPLSKFDLFHIPFEKRGKVRSQRYSIPGLPSLYLSNSIYGAWEEMLRPGFESIQAVRFSNNRELRLLDLSTDIYIKNEHLQGNENYGWQLLYKIMVWPLVAACSVKVKNFDDDFKPEYIIPQLLLQWINKNYLDGIKYSSTHIDMIKDKHQGKFYNFVLPVKTFDLDVGYCTALTQLFNSTQVLPMQLRQFISTADRFASQQSITADVNDHVQSIELIKGKPQPYFSTYFGVLEHSLNYLKLEPLC